MPHDPTNPKVAASYDAMIRETLGQWDAIKKTGLKVEFIPPDMPDPYAQTPRMAQQDVVKNNHLWVFPTEQGFGTGPEAAAANAANPMLRPAGEVNGRPVVANDIFRIVHDYFGHVKEGNGFRAGGEENAWRSHTAMYSPEARPAMTAETRGQNSWVNYGPHGENNRTANGGATVYAPQKIGLLPDWVMEEGRLDAPPTTTQKVPKSGVQTGTNPVQMARQRELEDPMMREPPPPPEPEGTHPLLGPGAVRVDISVADPFTGQAIKGRAFERAAAEASAQMKLEPKGAGPMNLGGPSVIQTEQTPIPRYEPPRGIPARMRDALQNPDVIQGVHDSIRKGVDLGAHEWYHTGPIHKSFVDVLGPEEGPKAFKQFMDLNAASSPRSEVPVNIRNASYYYSIMRSRGVLPERLPYPYGHIAQKLHRQNFETLRQAQAGGVGADIPTGGWDVMRNPKPPSYSQNLQGNLMPGTMDTHAYRNVVMRTGDQRFLVPQISEVIPSGRPSKFQQTFGEIKTNAKGKTIVTYRPRELHKTGRMTMEEMKKTPPFWESQPKANEYKAVEDFYRHMGQQHGLPTADAQAAAWAGGGDLTGLGSPPDKTFQQMMNERVLYTAKVRGENPRDTLRWLIQGRKPLLTIGGGALLGAGALRQNQPQR
jgi:hypothetical protein